MQFLRRNQYFLLTLAVLIFSSVMIIRQFVLNGSAHTQRVEDFILLHERDETRLTEQFYQILVQELPQLSDKALVDDLQRMAMVVDVHAAQPDSLLWKYQVSVGNELKRRSENRIHAALQRVEKP